LKKQKKEIEVLTAKLALLEKMENYKTPCEEAFKRVHGVYPMTDVGDGYWENFQAGYKSAIKSIIL
jgi:hypothetical protein